MTSNYFGWIAAHIPDELFEDLEVNDLEHVEVGCVYVIQ